jgi:dTDP-4-dehydrorhamnose reductase
MSPDIVEPTATPGAVSPGTGARAERPAYSVLGPEKLHAHGIEEIGPWEERWQAAASAVLVVEETE